MKRRHLLSSLAAAPAVVSCPAWAKGTVKIAYGYTAVVDFATVFIAVEQGHFRQRGLEVEPKFIPLNSTIPAALQADSLQVGGPTPSVFLQAVDGGLDLMVVAGAGVTSKSSTGVGFVARAGSGIRTAADCVGRKIGVPGLGAFLHVSFRGWLKSEGVDPKKVQFIEAAFPQHVDLLRGGSLDGVVTADPFMARATETGVGYVASYYATFMPEGQPLIVHAARRDWLERHPAAGHAFREAVKEAAAFLQQPRNDAAVRTAIGKYIKLPPPVLAKAQIAPPGPVVTPAQLSYWVGLMKDQEMLKGTPDVNRLIYR